MDQSSSANTVSSGEPCREVIGTVRIFAPAAKPHGLFFIRASLVGCARRGAYVGSGGSGMAEKTWSGSYRLFAARIRPALGP
jgi:hypothetical protein